MKNLLCLILSFIFISAIFAEPPSGKNWKLVFEDNFNYPTADLPKEWVLMNRNEFKMLCGRWPENAVIKDGILHLQNKKEHRAGQDWTSASLWTKKRFKYGYYEVRMRYAKSTGVNNAFWVATYDTPIAPDQQRFEIDINEGHYPDEISTNVHNWSDTWKDAAGRNRHRGWGGAFKMGKVQGSAAVSHNLDVPLPISKIRITSDHKTFFNLQEVMAYSESKSGKYPKPDVPIAAQKEFNGLENFAKNADIKVSGFYYKSVVKDERRAIDGDLSTSWQTNSSGVKSIELDFGAEKSIACVQFLSGWKNKGVYQGFIADYKIEYFSSGKWHTWIDVKEDAPDVNLSDDFHLYALEWNDKELVFYFDGKELRRFENKFIYSYGPVMLSAGIIEWAGAVTDKVDGTSMDVDYVKVWQEEGLGSIKASKEDVEKEFKK